VTLVWSEVTARISMATNFFAICVQAGIGTSM